MRKKGRRLQNQKVSVIPALRRSESGIATRIWRGVPSHPPKPSRRAAKHPAATTRGITTEPSIEEKTGGKVLKKSWEGAGQNGVAEEITTNVTEKGGKQPKASAATHALPGVGDTDEHTAVVLLLLSHHRPSVAIADGHIILLPGQIFIKAAFTNVYIYTHTYVATHTPGTIFGTTHFKA